MLLAWEQRLHNPQGPIGNHLKNQPHFNAALRDANLRVTLLPCNLFPNGYRYASEKWRAAQLWLNGEPWRPVSVHNNWIKGAAAKLRRFVEWGLWDNVTAPDPSRPAGSRTHRRGPLLGLPLKTRAMLEKFRTGTTRVYKRRAPRVAAP